MKEFEYLVKKMYCSDEMHTKFLNENTKLGWELVCVNSEPEKMGLTALYFFKRQISNNKETESNTTENETNKITLESPELAQNLSEEAEERIKSKVTAFAEIFWGKKVVFKEKPKTEKEVKFCIIDWLKDELFTEQSLTQGIIDAFEHAKLMLNEKEMVLVSALRKIDEMSPHGRNVDVIFDMKQTASHALKDLGYK